MEKLTLYSSIFSLNYYKGFSVIRSFSIDESAIFICNTANKLRKGETENKLPYYQNNQTILKPISSEENKDALYNEVINIMKQDGKFSISYIQRKLQIGYNRAARIIEQLEDDGVISKPNSLGKRELL
jgi:DNA segregation ATPase FtsK/SpoIIIE-like protein